MLTFSACKSKKVITQAEPSRIPIEKIKASLTSEPRYNFVSAKTKVSASSRYGTDKGTLYLRMIKDSMIWLSVKKLSVEGGRMLITQDSAFVINRLERSYQKFSLDELSEQYGLYPSLSYVQNMLMGLPPTISKDHKIDVESDSTSYKLGMTIGNIYHVLSVDKSTGHLEEGKFTGRFAASGDWQFDTFDLELDGHAIPRNRIYNIETEYFGDMRISIGITSFEVDNPVPIRFSIPSHYQRQR